MTDVKVIRLTFNLIRLNLCLMVSPVGWIYPPTKQLGRVTLWRGIVGLPKRTASRSLPPPRPRQAGAVRPFAHTTETSRLNSIAAAHWNDPTSPIAERRLKQSVEPRRPCSQIPKKWGLKGEYANLGIALPIPFYIERLPTYD